MGEGVFLAVNKILNCIFQILDFAQQPKGQLRQPKGAYEKRDHQQDKAVLRGVCHQDGHAQRNGSQQGGGKLLGVNVMGAADAPGRLPISSIIVGFGIFFNPALGPGASIGLFA